MSVTLAMVPPGRSQRDAMTRSVTPTLIWSPVIEIFRKYLEDPRLGELERQAREAKLGPWEEAHPVPPWE